MNLKVIFNEFKSQVAFVLLLIWLLAVWHFRTVNSVLYPLLAIGVVTLSDLVITWLRYHKLYFPSASIVTGFLIGLIVAPSEPWWIITAASLLASFAKQFIATGVRQHIFNPAAFGIVTVNLMWQAAVSWWAVAWGQLPLVILIPAMMRILWRMKRLWLAATFLGVYFGYYLTIFSPRDVAISLVDGSLLLFALVMLPEPITSPAVGLFKYFLGPLVALLAIGLTFLGTFAEVFLPALLLANLLGFLMLRFK